VLDEVGSNVFLLLVVERGFPVRIAFITHYTSLYGANRSLLNLIDGLKRYEVFAHIVSPGEGEITEALRERRIPIAIMPVRYWMSTRPSSGSGLKWVYRYMRWGYGAAKRLYRNIYVLPSLARQLRAWGIDLIYTNSSVIPTGALAAKCLRLPHVWHLRELGDLDYGLRPDWGTSAFRYLIGSADAIITNSKAVRSHLLNGVTNEHVYVIYNGVAWESDFDHLRELAQEERQHQRPYTFALVGIIHPNKGQEMAIRALAIATKRFPDIRLLIVGGGDATHLKRIATELGVIDNVEFWGYIHDPYKAYLAADAVLMCSKYEAMGRVTAEAMAACRPVIGYESGGTAEIIEHEHTGLLYRGGPEALATCMMRFVENPEWAQQLGENGWHVAHEKYSIEVYSESVYQVLCSVLGRKSE